MYIAKIKGTRYLISLESDSGGWYLRLKLGDVVEAEEAVTHMNKRGIHDDLGALFDKVNLDINSFQHDLIHKEITSQITHLLLKEGSDPDLDTMGEETPFDDMQVDQLIEKVDKLEQFLKTLEDRINRMEALSSE